MILSAEYWKVDNAKFRVGSFLSLHATNVPQPAFQYDLA